MAADPRNLALALKAQAAIQALDSETPKAKAVHTALNMIAVACAQGGLLDADGLGQLGFADPQATMAGPHPMDGGGGDSKKPN